MTTTVYYEGYNAAYDGFKRTACHYSQASDEYADWILGFDAGMREIGNDNDCGFDEREEFDSGRWTDDDERSMSAGRDTPLRNDAGEFTCG